MNKPKGLRERLADGESVICAEGYMWELERRGYIMSGAFTPEVVLDNPERVISLHEEYVHAGSDIVEAFNYYGHREKLKTIGREDDLEKLNITALRMARDVADKHGCLMSGSICNTTVYDPDDAGIVEQVKEMFKEQVEWSVKGEADMMIGETFNDVGEAKLALEAIKKYGKGMPAVITMALYFYDTTTDGVPIAEALRQLEEMGAAVVGLNCARGPASMLPVLKECRKVLKGPLAALPVPYRTTEKEKTFQSLTDPQTGDLVYPLDLNCVQCTRSDIRTFAREARALGVQYIGLCCGSSSNLLREVAVEFGRHPPAMKYAPNLHKSFVLGDLYGRSAMILSAMTGRDVETNRSKMLASAQLKRHGGSSNK